MILAAYHSDYRGVEAHPATLTNNALECIMAKRYFRSNYSEVNTQFEPPFDNAVCIPLTQGHHALVDADDFDLVKDRKWYSFGYAATKTRKYLLDNYPEMYANCTLMHRVIMDTGNEIDHINMNPLDNRKSNLRQCKHGQNQANRKVKPSKRHGRYKGTGKNGKGWWARVSVNGKSEHLGTFKTEEEAALAYNKAAIEHYGEFARLNIIGEPQND